MARRTLFTITLVITALSFSVPEAAAQVVDRERVAGEIEALRDRIGEKEALLLAPSIEDRERYAEFLAQPQTGLVRLLPREKWDGKLSTRGGGAYYSFSRLTHEYGHGSDIELQQNQLMVGFAGADFGFMVNLGDAPLETVSEETEAVRFMAEFKTPSAEPEARAARRRFAARPGHAAGQWTYKSALPVVAGNTYALRSVNYDDADVLVAFRVVRRDSDGSVVLLWKLLNTFPKPKLRRDAASAGL